MKHKMVLISGKQGSGKSTLAEGLFNNAVVYGHLPVYLRFASVIYEMHDAALAVAKKYGVPVNKKEGDLLQYIGTEWGRALKGENVWVNALKTRVEQEIVEREILPNGVDYPLLVVIDDMRFPNEFNAFMDSQLMVDGTFLEVKKLRLVADTETRKARCSYWRENDQHTSETGLDIYADEGKFDLYIGTSGVMGAEETLNIAIEAVFHER